MGFAETAYSRLPVWAQHVAVSMFGLTWYWHRFGPGYRRYVQEYAERDRWNANQWRTWQQAQLKDLLQTASQHVPYYQHAWEPATHTAARAGRLKDLPLLDKETVRQQHEAFLRQDRPGHPRFAFHTSGTTGTPMELFWTTGELRRGMAVREVRSTGWAGVSYTMPRATIGGRLPVPDPESQGPFYRYNLVERQVYFSPYHLRPDTAPSYVQALWRHRPQWLTGLAVSY
jgi:phenylacetate-CoA ligase